MSLEKTPWPVSFNRVPFLHKSTKIARQREATLMYHFITNNDAPFLLYRKKKLIKRLNKINGTL